MPGVRWRLAIMDALKGCDLFVLLLSSRSIQKNGFVQKEIAEALEKLKDFPPDQIFLIPARLDDCHPKHPELHDIQWVDLFPSWDEGIRAILHVVEHQLAEPIKLPAPAENVIIETVNSQRSFTNRLSARGELRAVDAMEIDFSECDLGEYDFSGANFVRCRFDRALLRGVNFEGALFSDCTISSADLWGVNFWGADIRGLSDFEAAILEQTNFYHTRASQKQNELIANGGQLHLPDYGTFADYFRKEIGMSDEDFGTTFPWYEHRYFRLMFGKNEGSALRSTFDLAVILRRAAKTDG